MKMLFVSYRLIHKNGKGFGNSVIEWNDKIQDKESVLELCNYIASQLDGCEHVIIINWRRME